LRDDCDLLIPRSVRSGIKVAASDFVEASAASNMTTPSEIVRRALRQAFKKRGKSQPHRDREVAHAA